MPDQDKQLDQLLDSLLADYSDVEPRPGMETRLLANLRAESLPAVKSRWRVRKWFFAAAGVVAVAVLLFAIYLSQISNLPQPAKIDIAGPPSLPVFHGPEHTPKKNRVSGPDAARSMVDVRREVFPAPSPLSDQERLLMQYLATTPKEEVAAQSHSDKLDDTSEAPAPQSQQFTETETQSSR